MTEFNVGESDGTVYVALAANGLAEFDYTVNLTVNDITTGVCVCVWICAYTRHYVHPTHGYIATLLLINVKTVNFYRSE